MPDRIYAFDQGYYDSARLKFLSNSWGFLRGKNQKQCAICGSRTAPENQYFTWRYCRKNHSNMTGCQTAKKHPGKLRLMEFVDHDAGKSYRFIANNFRLAASTIAGLCKRRRQIELFCKWIKQNLNIKSFPGNSARAAMTQIMDGINPLSACGIYQNSRKIYRTEVTPPLDIAKKLRRLKKLLNAFQENG